MALKCRCICGCKLLVSAGSAGKRIKCPKCERKLRVPVDVVEKRRAQVESRKAKRKADPKPKPKPKRSKIDKPLSSLLDLPDPTPPPLPKGDIVESRSDDKQAEAPNSIEKTELPDKPLMKGDTSEDTARELKASSTDASEEEASKVERKDHNESVTSDEQNTDGLEKEERFDRDLAPTTKQEELLQPSATVQKQDEVAPKPLATTATTSTDRDDVEVHSTEFDEPPADHPTHDNRLDADAPATSESNGLPEASTAAAAEQSVTAKVTGEPSDEVAPKLLPPIEPSQTESESEGPVHSNVAAVDEQRDDIEVPLQGYVPNRDQVSTVRSLAAAMMVTGLIGMVPAMIDIIEHFLSQSSDGVSRWASVVLLVSVLQCAYAIYLVQLPDWSSIRVVTVFAVTIAATYAAMLGLTLLSTDQGHFVQILDLADRLQGGKASSWCLIMLGLMSLTGYFSGRIANRWQSAFAG